MNIFLSTNLIHLLIRERQFVICIRKQINVWDKSYCYCFRVVFCCFFFFFNIKNSSITTSYGELFMVKFSHVFLCYRPIKYSILIQSKLFTENKCHYVIMSFSICWPYLDFGGWVGYEGFSNSLYFSWDTNYSLNFLFYPFCCILKIPKMKIFEKWEISGNAWEYFFKVNIA